ncbi:MAG: hypothetical protein JRF33_06960 [Deltaproteobacteria bacterium]|nr:hypothetical protein [Deltaproteobacteria bacterium]
MKTPVLMVIACLFMPTLAMAQAPAWMPVQAYLADAEGSPLTGEHDIILTLYGTDVGGQALLAETQTVLLEEGLATLFLGSNQPLDLSLFANNIELFLGIAVDEDPEMTPRFPLGTVPFAAFAEQAGNALSLDGRAADEFLLAADNADILAAMSCAEGQVAKASATGWICADDLNTDSGGDITEVNAGDGLLGGGVNGPVTLAVEFGDSGVLTSVARSDHDHALAYAAIGHDHEATYVDEGQADSITSAMITDGEVSSADIAEGTIVGSDLDPATTLTAAAFEYQTPQIRYLSLAGGTCIKNLPATNEMFSCQLGANNTVFWPVDLPLGANITGFRGHFFSNTGTIACNLRRGSTASGTSLAQIVTTLNGNWHWSPEVALNHTVDTIDNAYGVECRSNGLSTEQPVSMLQIRYTVPGP